jgi:hypothetical protein
MQALQHQVTPMIYADQRELLSEQPPRVLNHDLHHRLALVNHVARELRRHGLRIRLQDLRVGSTRVPAVHLERASVAQVERFSAQIASGPLACGERRYVARFRGVDVFWIESQT